MMYIIHSPRLADAQLRYGNYNSLGSKKITLKSKIYKDYCTYTFCNGFLLNVKRIKDLCESSHIQ